ncbi:Sugar phosphate isomerase/epimerase [Muriicola jejuensis]|uniref:TIM barrel protein n=1 Tax=Muriicola jejuensis TaxID=504488 RepID=A0A6P0U909_9FLAO|nr:sugar phosphate isomerase/epimerase [Muriicola jejuensis]NER09567.1 TIM barrel protein [Muriicola jejuensis]SMP07730.1 Sugar phosphate isomerase/epimerase [Muriicola jejuensis]
MIRRDFILNTTLTAGAVLALGAGACAPGRELNSIGIQLFSLPKSLEKDLEGSLEMLSRMGYREVELYGPFPFSSESARARWERVTPALGFSGSGFFGRPILEFATLLKQYGLRATSSHIDLETLQTRMTEVGEAARTLGLDCMGISAIPEEKRNSLDDYRRMAEEFNIIGEKAKKEGFKFIYHNHGYGLQEVEGVIPFDLILERTDHGLVFFEMDIYWTSAGGADPIQYLRSYPGRYLAMHLKDMKESVTFSGDGGTSDQWIELFPYMTTVGNGVLDIRSIVQEAQKAGVKHFFVEQDTVQAPEIALKESIDFLKKL